MTVKESSAEEDHDDGIHLLACDLLVAHACSIRKGLAVVSWPGWAIKEWRTWH